jgi:hypothetical protein
MTFFYTLFKGQHYMMVYFLLGTQLEKSEVSHPVRGLAGFSFYLLDD